MSSNDPSISEILKGQLYLGNLSSALSLEHRKKYGITHILSVCPDFPQAGHGKEEDCHHLNIPVEDSEFEDILTHLPRACQFIEDALEQDGRVLVHCVMGVSRSPAVVAAFLMKKEMMAAPQAITFVKQRRPIIHLNYGFARQLDTFMKCNFRPTHDNPVYRSWKRRHQQDVNALLSHIEDTVTIIPDKLLVCSDFPSSQEQIWSYLMDMGVTHLLAISPAEISVSSVPIANYHHVNVNSRGGGADADSAFLDVLPDVCAYIDKAIRQEGGLVLVYSMIESRCCTAVCSYLMAMKKYTAVEAFGVIRDALPLFNPTRNFIRNLELYEQRGYTTPTLSLIPASHVESCAETMNSTGDAMRNLELGRAQGSVISVQ